MKRHPHSRASILTGVYPRRSGKYIARYSMRNRKFRRIETMTQLFRRHGSRALGGGKIFPPLDEPERHWDVHRPFKRPASQKRNGRVPLSGLALPHPRDGFDWGAVEYRHEEMSDVRIAQWAIGVLQEEHDRPFFLGVGFHLPHLPWYLPGEYFERYPLESIELPEVRDDDLDDVPPEGRTIAWKHPRTKEVDYQGSDHATVLEGGRVETGRTGLQRREFLRRRPDWMDSRGARREPACAGHDRRRVRRQRLASRGEAAVARDDAVGGVDADSADPELSVPAASRPDGPVRGQPGRSVPHPAGADRTAAARPRDGRAVAAPAARRRRRVRRTLRHDTRDRGSVAIRDARWRFIRYAKGGQELYDHDADPMEHTNLLALPDAHRHAERVAYFNAIIDRYHGGAAR